MLASKKILCLDFDGVIHSYTSPWVSADVIPDPPVDGAIEFMRRASGEFVIAIFSSRSHQTGGIEAMQAWLRKYGADDALMADIQFPQEKPPAFVTIDDRALTFDGTWPSVETLKYFKPWNRK